MLKTFRIGDLARAADIPVETIRYYEQSGLMPRPQRSEGNFRLYQQVHRERLTFIRQCRALDMTMEEIRRLLSFKDDPTQNCQQVGELVVAHIKHISERITELERLRKDLKMLSRLCETPEEASRCKILGGLSAGTATQQAPKEGPIARDRRRHASGLSAQATKRQRR